MTLDPVTYLHPLHNNIGQGHRDKPRDGGTFCGTEGRFAGRRDEGGGNPGTEGHVAGRRDEKIINLTLTLTLTLTLQ